jgi:signal peptidase
MKVLSTLWNIVSTILVGVIVVLAILLAGVRLVGLRPFTVLSGSMEPAYHVGSLIYVKACDPEDVQVGDAITFVLDENLTVATHRVIEIDAENEHFYTKGDANDAADGAPVYFKNLIGRPVFTIPYLGYFSNWITNPPGMYVALAAAGVFLILLFLPDVLKKADEADRRAAEKKRQKEEAAE